MARIEPVEHSVTFFRTDMNIRLRARSPAPDHLEDVVRRWLMRHARRLYRSTGFAFRKAEIWTERDVNRRGYSYRGYMLAAPLPDSAGVAAGQEVCVNDLSVRMDNELAQLIEDGVPARWP